MSFRFFLVACTLISSVLVHGDNQDFGAVTCSDAIDGSNTSFANAFIETINRSSESKTKINFNQAVFKTAQYILKSKTFPSEIEVAKILGMTYKNEFADLLPEEQITIRDELVTFALSRYPDVRATLLEKIAKVTIKEYSKKFSLPTFEALGSMAGIKSEHVAQFLYHQTNPVDAYSMLIQEIRSDFPQLTENLRNQILMIYTTRARRYGRTLSMQELLTGILEKKPELSNSFTISHLQALVGEDISDSENASTTPTIHFRLFDSMHDVYNSAQQRSPQHFDKVLNKFSINEDSHQTIVELLKTKKRVLVTSAAQGVPVHEEAFATMIKMAEDMDAFILVYAEARLASNLDPVLTSHPLVHIIHDNIEITPWIKLNTLPVHFKRVDPLSPLRQPGRGGPREQTQIVGHPQMRDEMLTTIDNDLHPRRHISTGAITKSWYAAKFPIGGVTDDMARDVHTIGAFLLEKSADTAGLQGIGMPNSYFGRHVEWSNHSRSFTDNGRRYSLHADDAIQNFKPLARSGSVSHHDLVNQYLEQALHKRDVRPEYYIPGDKHIGGEDHFGFSNMEIAYIKERRPKRLVAHDLIENSAIRHWDTKDMIKMAEKARNGELSLQNELDQVVAYINFIQMLDPEIVVLVVESNHNNWLRRLLSEINKSNQPINDPLVAELMHAQLNLNTDPLSYYLLSRATKIAADNERRVIERNVMTVHDSTRIQILPKGASLKVGPIDNYVEIAEHGHNSPGFRGPGLSLQTTAGRFYTGIAFGHTHSSGRNNRAANAGASISPKQSYANGASSTSMGFIEVYADGVFQVHQYDVGSESYSLGDGEPLPPDQFFYLDPVSGESWPRVLENEEKNENLNTLDQFRRVHPDEKK